MRACVRACVRPCVCVCLFVCACVRACTRAYVCGYSIEAEESMSIINYGQREVQKEIAEIILSFKEA